MFPQLEGLRFTHRWAGAIDTCTQFCAFYGLARRGRVAYTAGFTGLGVGAARFAADVMLDLLGGEPTGANPAEHGAQAGPSRSRRNRSPRPVSSSPAGRWTARITSEGRRNPLMRTLDRMGLGFDS